MKKVLIGMLMISLIILTGCNDNSKKGGEDSSQNDNVTMKYTSYTEVNYTQLQEKINNKDSFVIVFGSDTCSACKQYKVTMESVIKEEQVEVFYLDLNETTETEYSKIYSKYVITSTPTTVFIKDGLETSVYDRLVGTVNSTRIKESLKKHGFIGD